MANRKKQVYKPKPIFTAFIFSKTILKNIKRLGKVFMLYGFFVFL